MYEMPPFYSEMNENPYSFTEIAFIMYFRSSIPDKDFVNGILVFFAIPTLQSEKTLPVAQPPSPHAHALIKKYRSAVFIIQAEVRAFLIIFSVGRPVGPSNSMSTRKRRVI